MPIFFINSVQDFKRHFWAVQKFQLDIQISNPLTSWMEFINEKYTNNLFWYWDEITLTDLDFREQMSELEVLYKFPYPFRDVKLIFASCLFSEFWIVRDDLEKVCEEVK